MKQTLPLCLLFLSVFCFGQIHSVSKKISEIHSKNQKFTSFELFSVNKDVYKTNKYFTSVTDITVLNLDKMQLQKLVNAAPDFIRISVPYQSESIQVELYKQEVVTENFIAKDENGNAIDFKLGEYYRGIIKGDAESLVAVSFFEDDVIGVVSSRKSGNVILGKSTDRQDFITYSDKNMLGANPFTCGADELEANKNYRPEGFDPAKVSSEMTENCVKIYYEIAYAPYLENGSNTQNTINWITGVQNNIATLYENDNIKIALNEIKIWTTPDPYDGTYQNISNSWEANLYQFRDTVTEFNGDLAHLINYPSTTSVAFLNSLCGESRYAYSGIDMYYEQVPAYSWTIMAMTHEMGHSMGSPHTHACFWNGNNTAIDGCGPWAGYDEGCDAPIPDDGGTIMSYCHQVFGEINLTNGFGVQPAAHIRNTVDSKYCLGSDCIESCSPTVESVAIQEINENSYQITISDNTSHKWSYRVYEYGTAPSENWATTTTPSFSVNNLEPNKYFYVDIKNVCENGLMGDTDNITILTGNWCGQSFVDTGGTSGHYDDYQTIIKTFYPAVEGEKVQLSFSQFDLEQDYDFMYIYNGSSINSPLFPNGNELSGNFIPGPFVSTADDGSLTVKFVSDGGYTSPGWVALVDCTRLSVEDISGSNGIRVYPNPASSALNIDSKKEIISIKLNDVSGKVVLNKKINSLKEKVNIEHLPKGVYILTVEMKDQIVTKKIIKN